ncbi:MAG: hypothetical protein KGQ67_12700 [Betaproteobacteria bacterium]|nr:hypothetical protein [Betaproteobacteria bacterium]
MVPTLTVESSPGGVISGPIAVRFQFSGDVANFDDVSGFSVSGGTVVAGSFTRITLSEYSVRIAPFAEQVGTIRMAVHTFDIKDASGAAGRRSLYGFAWPYDTITRKVPLNWATIRDALGDAPWTGGPLVLTITFNVPISKGFTPEALSVDGATLGEFTQVSGTVYTVKMTPTVPGNYMFLSLEPASVGVAPMPIDGFSWQLAAWSKTKWPD